MVRRGLRMVLEEEEGFEVVAEAGDAETALLETRAHQPQVVLLDLNMPGTPPLDAIPRFRQGAAGTAVVMLTMEDDVAFAQAAMEAGASGYVLKEGAESELVNAVRSVAAGRTYLDPALGARLISPRQPPDAAVALGSRFAGHRIDAIAGTGAMGVVYRATDLALDRPVALKLITPALAGDPVFRARFEGECRLAAGVGHPHVGPIFHAGTERGQLYVTMRYVDGPDLRALLTREGRLAPERAIDLMAQVAGALDAAHAHGLVHRDVKPANVLIERRGAGEHAFLTDFGISKRRTGDPELTGTGLAVGTSGYIAPEQAQGLEVDGRADVYALACILFQAVTGQVPFPRESELDAMWAHVHEPPPELAQLRPDLPGALGDAIAAGLAKDPAVRPATAGEWAASARAGLRG